MGARRTHFELRAAALEGVATMHHSESHGATTMKLRPQNPDAAGVVPYLGPDEYGTVALEDPAAAPTEIGGDLQSDLNVIDAVIQVAVDGRAVAFHVGRGGCVEESDGDRKTRSWHNASPWPGWRGRAERVDYAPYR